MNHTRHATNRILLRARDTMDRDYRASHQPDVVGAAIPSCELRRWSRPAPGVAAGRLE